MRFCAFALILFLHPRAQYSRPTTCCHYSASVFRIITVLSLNTLIISPNNMTTIISLIKNLLPSPIYGLVLTMLSVCSQLVCIFERTHATYGKTLYVRAALRLGMTPHMSWQTQDMNTNSAIIVSSILLGLDITRTSTYIAEQSVCHHHFQFLRMRLVLINELQLYNTTSVGRSCPVFCPIVGSSKRYFALMVDSCDSNMSRR